MKSPIRCGVLIAGLALLALPLASLQAQSARPLASLDPVQGLVQTQPSTANPADLTAWQTVTQRVLVGEGDRIRTNGAGLAYLTFFEGIDTEIGPNTLVVVSTLALPTGAAGTFDISLDVLVGSTFSTVEATLDPGERFEIHTPGATAVVRGTRWWTVVTPAGETTFSAERGTLDILFHALAPAAPVGAPPPPDEQTEATGAPPIMAAAPAPVFELRAGMGLVTSDRFGAVVRMADRFQPPARPVKTALAQADCGDGICRLGERVTCPVDCRDRLTLRACGNGTCEPGSGEDLLLCPADCGPWPGQACGNGTCDLDESGITCPVDCAPDRYFAPFDPALCGNGTCDASESALRCPADCRPGEQLPDGE